jgi:pilus assembly protein CpaE
MSGQKGQRWADLLDGDDPAEFDDDLDFISPAAQSVTPTAPVGQRSDFDVSSFEQAYSGELERGGDQPVPRIAIQAFCERPETAQLLQAGSTDRRLAKASMTVALGGVAGAIEFFSTQSNPNLIIVESTAPPHVLIAQLDQLAAHCDAGVKVLVIGVSNDIQLYRELIRRGVSEYLVPPLQPLQVIRAISGLYADPSKPFVGKVMAFVGARGGAGSSTICHNLAWTVAEQIRVNCTLVDLDLSWGTTGLDFNQDPVQGVADALVSPERVDDVLLDRLLTRQTDQLTLFTAPATLDRDYEVDAEAYETVIDGVRRGVPYVMLDLPHVWSPWVRRTLTTADEVIITATPDLASLRNAKNLFDLLKTARPNDGPPKLIMNQVGVPKRPEIPIKDFADALGAEPILVLPFDAPLYAGAANNGQMLAEAAPESKAAEGMNFLAQLLTGRAPPPKPKGLLAQFKGLKIGKK